jgi:hypothetical protein
MQTKWKIENCLGAFLNLLFPSGFPVPRKIQVQIDILRSFFPALFMSHH